MKYFLALFLIISFGCNQPKQKNEKRIEEKEVINEEVKIEKLISEKIYEKLFIVLKNPKNIKDSKALIVNSGLIWEELAIDDTNLKAAFIKVPFDKTDFWIERLKTSNTFSSVEINSEKAIEKAKYIAENTFVKIRKTHCSGDCPVFDITFFKDGKVIFNGIENVPIKGIKEFTLTENQLKKATDLFSNTSFNTYSSVLIDKTIADYPSTFITHKNKEIEIKLWKNVAEELIIAFEYLDGILLENKLIE